MAEGELNVDSLISRLLEGKQFLQALVLHWACLYFIRKLVQDLFYKYTRVPSENEGNNVSESVKRPPLVTVYLRLAPANVAVSWPCL